MCDVIWVPDHKHPVVIWSQKVSIYIGYTFWELRLNAVILDFIADLLSYPLERSWPKQNSVVSCTVASVIKLTVMYRRRH